MKSDKPDMFNVGDLVRWHKYPRNNLGDAEPQVGVVVIGGVTSAYIRFRKGSAWVSREYLETLNENR